MYIEDSFYLLNKVIYAFWFQCLFLLWCMAPMTWNGSQIIYNKVVRPIFLRHETMVDNMVSNLGAKAMNAAENLTREGTDQFNTSTLWLQTKIFWLNVASFPLFSPDHSDEEQISGDSDATGRSAWS